MSWHRVWIRLWMLAAGWWKVWKSSLCANTAWLHNTVLLHLSDCITLVYCIALYCRVVYCVELLSGILHCIESYLCHSYHIALHFRMKSSELRCLWVIFKCNNISLCSNTAWLPSEPGIAFYQIALHCIANFCLFWTHIVVGRNQCSAGRECESDLTATGTVGLQSKSKKQKASEITFYQDSAHHVNFLSPCWIFKDWPCSDCVTVIPRKLQQ